MDGLLQHVLLAIAVACVAGTGWRVASLAAPRGLERIVATAVLAMATVVIQTLALGVLGLADRSGLLVLLAAAGYAAARALTPRPALGMRSELAAAWRGAGPAAQAVAGGLLATLAGWIAWQLVHPNVLFDGETYHLPLAASWAQSGHTAQIVGAIDGVPVANYPVTNEVAVSWGLALSHSWVVASVWSPLVVALLVLSGWLGLRRLSVGRGIAALGIGAYVLLPFVAAQLGGPLTDVPCTTWLVACAALCAASREHPRLLGVALVAAGLSFGTKTTGSVLLLLTLGLAAWVHRSRLRELAPTLLAGLGVAALVGAPWALRNLVDHGSPLWPFVSGPFGDPIPEAFRGLDRSFLEHPRAMLEGRTSLYLENLSGGTLLLAAGILAPLLGRSRAALAAGGAALLAALVWSRAPFTGISSDTALAVGAIRYLLPALAMAVLALAIAARDGGRIGRYGVGTIFVLAILVSSAKTFGDLGFPYVPGNTTVLGLFVVGAAAALLWPRIPGLARAAVPALAVAGAVVGLTAGADGYVARQTEAGSLDQGVLRAALRDHAWRTGDFPIHMGPLTAALLRGDDLEHRVALLPAATPCPAIRALPGWVVVVTNEASPEATRLQRCLRAVPAIARDKNFTIYAPDAVR